MRKKHAILLLGICLVFWNCSQEKKAEYLLQHFIDSHEEELEKLHGDYSMAQWDIYTKNSSIDNFYNTTDSLHEGFRTAKAETSLRLLYDNTSEYDYLKRIKNSGLIKNTLLKRQLEKLYNEYAWAKLDIYGLNDKQAELSNKFYKLETSKPDKASIQYLGSDSILTYDKRRNKLIETFKETVHEKNRAARKAGHEDFWEYWLYKNEITSIEHEQLITSIDESTREDYLFLKHTIDSVISAQTGIATENISYSDFYLYIFKLGYPPCWQIKFEPDSIAYFITKYFKQKELNTEHIFKNSDITWGEHKAFTSFVINMDSRYDVRIYSNLMPNFRSLTSLMHEMGHAFYYSSISKDVPFILREPNRAMNEGVGFMFQSLFNNDPALRECFNLPKPESNYFKKITMPYMLFTCRDLLVRAELEKQLFKNPDQDINKLFWDLKKKYLFYDQADDEKVPLWIQDKHIIHNSGVYQSYLYAAVIGSMLLEKTKTNNEYGTWLSEEIFRYGDSKNWLELLENSTETKFTTVHISNLYK